MPDTNSNEGELFPKSRKSAEDRRREDWTKGRTRSRRSVPTQPAEGSTLQFWGDRSIAGIPPELARGGVFRLPRRGQRDVYHDQLVVNQPSLQVRYSGDELDQSDLDVFLQILRVLRGKQIGEYVEVTLNGLVRGTRRSEGGKAIENMKNSLDRLSKAIFQIRFQRKSEWYRINTNLMVWLHKEETKQNWVKTTPEALDLFRVLAWLNFEKHVVLNNSMAKALHAYAISHRRGATHSVRLERLKNLWGYRGRVSNFRAALRKALNELEESHILADTTITDEDVARWMLLEIHPDESE